MSAHTYLILLFYLITIRIFASGKVPNYCGTQTTCSECLYFDSNCAWCSKWDNDIKVKCNLKENLIEAGCEEEYIHVAEQSSVKVIQDNDFNDMGIGDIYDAVQLKPQHVKIKIGQYEKVNLNILMRPARNYPLDLYFLMDSSYSMLDDVQTIISIGEELKKQLKNLTENYRLGFGTFSDKPTMPWIRTEPEHIENPCISEGRTCKPPYDFKHILTLTNDSAKFIEETQHNMITGNLDNVDGGLDALMQVIVCSQTGWLNDTRRIIIMATDSLFHFAGDGKLGGIIKPNDAKCHLDDGGFYNGTLLYDYPSISQIYNALNKYKVNVIFAVTESVKPIYNSLNELIPKFTYVARLEEDSSNIIEVLTQGYESIISKINLQDNATDPLSITYKSNCNQEGDTLVETSSCTNVQMGKTYKFQIELNFQNCPKNKNERFQRFIIEEANLGTENIIVDVEMLCDCTCNLPENIETNSSKCSYHGDEVCGLCKCEKPWLGKECECNSIVAETSLQLQDQCRQTDSIYKCSNRGECICGICHCDEGFSGAYCECPDCKKSNGKRCSGHGRCQCGQCICEPEYGGTNCECLKSTQPCIKKDRKEICEGRGECECGKCKCKNIMETEFTGQHCETVLTQDCSQFEDCVSCILDENCLEDSKREYCLMDKVIVNITMLNTTSVNENENPCTFRYNLLNGETCDYNFIYSPKLQQDNAIILNMTIYAKNCQKPAIAYFNLYILFAVLIAVYVLIMAIIKGRNYMKDRAEYKAFLDSKNQEIKMENPLYKSPTTHHEVPTGFKKND